VGKNMINVWTEVCRYRYLPDIALRNGRILKRNRGRKRGSVSKKIALRTG
jgi:hypothetical protein